MNATVIAAVISVLGVGFLGMLGYFLQGIRSELRDLRAEMRDMRSDIGDLRAELHQVDLRLVRVEELVRQQGQQIDMLDTRLGRVEELVGEDAVAAVPA